MVPGLYVGARTIHGKPMLSTKSRSPLVISIRMA
jgi:hypothetical protein